MRSSTLNADTRAAQAALARHSVLELDLDRLLVIDDSDEDATQILTVHTERTCPRNTFLEVQS